MRQLKLKRGVNSGGMLKQKGIKQGLVLYTHSIDKTLMWDTCNCKAKVQILSPQ